MTPLKKRSLLAATLAGALVVSGWTANAIATPNEDPNPNNDVETNLDDAIWETVFIESAVDTDGSGEPDQIAVEIVRPAETEDGEQVPVIAQPSPYYDMTEAQIAGSDIQLPIGDGQDPRHFSQWYHEHFVPLGYAYIEPEMQGTANSTGCPTTGGVEDTSSMEAVVDWIAGRTTAEYEDGTPAEATWAEPNIGMIGTSYNGTLPNAAAATGMEEVKAIVPIAAISSWYDYTRTQGAGHNGWDFEYVKGLAGRVANPEARDNCADLWDDLAAEADDDTYDMNDLWDERNYLNHADQVDAGVLHVHGQDDHNVKTTHTGQWWYELAEHDVDQKLWLHPGAHSDPTGSDEGRELVQDWFDYFLKGVDNGILDTPDVIVDREDGTTDYYDDWPNPDGDDTTLYFGEDSDGVGTLSSDSSATGSHTSAGNIFGDTNDVFANPFELQDERSIYLTDAVEGDQHLSGITEVDLTFSSSTSSTPLSAVLFAYGEENETGRFLTHGSADGKNHADLWAEEALVPGDEYSMTLTLQPRDEIIADGERIGLAVIGNHPELNTQDDEFEALDIYLGESSLNLNLTPLS